MLVNQTPLLGHSSHFERPVRRRKFSGLVTVTAAELSLVFLTFRALL